MKIKTTDLKDAALKWAVATALGLKPVVNMESHGKTWSGLWLTKGEYVRCPDYAADWAQGGPIIFQENIQLLIDGKGNHFAVQWIRGIGYGPRIDGSTPLIAAMRCYVSSCLGETIDVPGEICG